MINQKTKLPEINGAEKLQTIEDKFFKALEPPEDIDLATWSDKYRILPRISSSEPGPWRTERFPFLREIMQELSPQSPAKKIVVMKGAQLGFTEVAINWQFYSIVQNPCPMLYIQKTIETAKRFSKQRFNPSADEMPIVKDIIGEAKSRDGGNTIAMKLFPGGLLILGGANSAASLRSIPIQNLMIDEQDSFEKDIDQEGDPSELAIRRTANFPKRKIYFLSTPKIKETSKIEPAFELGDQRFFYIACPFCDHRFIIEWRLIKYKDNDPKTAKLLCEGCNKLIEERYKNEMFAKGEWIKHNQDGLYPSFHINSLYSPLGFYSWQEAVELWVKSQKDFDKELLKVFINTVLGETFSETGKEIEAAGLMRRREDYPMDLPYGVKLLCAGVDVQDDRLECEVIGFGSGDESWSIEYEIFLGDTELQDVWLQLDAYLGRTWKHEKGLDVPLGIVGIDSGYRAKVVYDFCKQREHRRIFAVKGTSGWGKGYINKPNARLKEGIFLTWVFVDEVKSKIYSMLKVEMPGPGFCHFPKKPIYDNRYFRGLTAERLITGRQAGHAKLKWDLPKGRRNEPLDCRAYAIAARSLLNLTYDDIDKFYNGVYILNRQIAVPKRKRILSKGV